MRPRVITTKHIVQQSLATATAGNRINIKLISAVAASDVNLASEIQEGSVISAIYLEYWIKTNDSSEGTAIAVVTKLSNGVANPSSGEMALLNDYQNKKNIFFTFMGLTNPNTGVGTPMLHMWLKIPKGKQRFGLGDELVLTLLSQTGTLQLCGFTIFKEQR